MNIRTLDNTRDRKDGDKKNRETYVGGESSGQAVEDRGDLAQKIIQQAEANSKSKPEGEESQGEPDVIVTLYADGFVCSDEKKFHFYTDPENKLFLEELLRGYVPHSMQKRFNRAVKISIDDQRKTTYANSHPEVNHFRGNQTTISGGTAVPITKPSAPIGQALSAEFVPVPGLPAFDLQLRFKTGEKKVIRVNETTRIAQVLEFCRRLTKTNNVALMTVFPKNNVTASPLTLKELDLLDSSLDVVF